MKKVLLSKIKIGERNRKDMGDIESLAFSIQRHGLFHPIVIDEDYNLVAGERRFTACQKIGMREVEVNEMKDLTDLDKVEIELEENIRRKDLTWTEDEMSKLKLYRVKQQLYGKAIKGHGGGFGIKELAESLGQSQGKTNQDIQLAEAMEKYPELNEEDKHGDAWRKYQRIREGEARDEYASRIKLKLNVDCLMHGDSTLLIKDWKDNSIDLFLVDPPYGIDIDKGTFSDDWMEKIYEDKPKEIMKLLSVIFPEMYRCLKNDRHTFVFYGAQHYETVKSMLEDCGFHVHPVPSMWNKTSAGAGASAYTMPTAYEPFLCGMKGKRPYSKVISNVLSYSRIPPSNKIHPTQKPIDLLKKLISISTEVGETVADLFAGSGSTLVSAIELSRKPIGIEKDERYFNEAMIWLNKVLKGE